MSEIRRNLAILASGVAFLGAGGGAGYGLSRVNDPYKNGSPVEQYADCAHELRTTAPSAQLPSDCYEAVVWKHPERHDDHPYPDNYGLAAGHYVVDPSGFAFAKAEAAQQGPEFIDSGLALGLLLWAGGVMILAESRQAQNERNRT